MFYITIHPDEAVRRNRRRMGRHTPEQLIRERHISLTALLPRYRELADEFHVFDNSDPDQPYARI